MPTIPYQFKAICSDPHENYVEHLDISENADLIKVEWKHVNLPICHEKAEYYPSIESISERTPAFTDHYHYGFTLGSYSEFFVYDKDWGENTCNVTFFFGAVEVSLGDASPLIQYIYDGREVTHYHPPVWETRSIRILGAPESAAEALLLYSVVKLKKHFDLRFRLLSYHQDLVDWGEEYEEQEETTQTIRHVERFQAPILETAPLRLLNRGMSEEDPTSAFLQFFRVLEYYCLVPYESKIETLRQDRNLTTRDFLSELQGSLDRDEKRVISGVIGRLVDGSMVKDARQSGLISQETTQAFCSAIYEFRNSLVHAKSDRASSIHTKPLFQTDVSTTKWKEICEELALRALEQFGRRSQT